MWWLNQYARGSNVKVLHVGNIANNAYSNAKFLRRKGVEADVLCYDYRHIMGQPEWEDAVFEGDPDEFEPDWSVIDAGDFKRPDWFQQDTLALNGAHRTQRFKGQFRLERILFSLPSLWSQVLATYLECHRAGGTPMPHVLDLLHYLPKSKRFEEWFGGYDLIQAYATEPIHAWMFSSGRPYVAFEHGTMREIPFERSARGRLLSLAYRQAGKVIITNPDVIMAARQLGLNNFLFIPHPVDETKYRPFDTPLRAELTGRYQADVILFAPSRHNWALKGNDLLLKAVARCMKSFSGKILLIVSEWGQEILASKALIDALGIQSHVMWTAPLNKMKLIHYYNAADVVLDQFTIGTFGTVTPEAMACAKPVVLHFDRNVHEWCYSDMPPVVSARTEDQIFARLMELIDSRAHRVSVGQASRDWIVKHHGWELVADRQIAVYRELLLS
jgi:glycosyltransferase involved in cell wall biosynthesis